jgi:glutathione S-transferase
MIRLHRDRAEPATLKLLLALAETGAEYETVAVDTTAWEQWAPGHRALAPQGELPVLVVDGLVMTDAQYALQYLGERFDRRLTPAEPRRWYEVQALGQRLDAALAPAANLLGWTATTSAAARAEHRARLAAIPEREQPAGWFAVWADAEAGEDQLANARARIEQAFDELEARLGGADWLVGDAWSLADIDAFALVRVAAAAHPDALAGRPALRRWLERVGAREPVRAVLADEGEVAFAAPV